MTLFALKAVHPNPFRDMKRYPISPDKVAALRESITATGFWNNVVGRIVDGRVELAYGFHRLLALRDQYGPDHKVEIPIEDLSDADMLKILCRENSEAWTTSAADQFASVRAVVEAYAAGKITLPKPGKKAKKSDIRYAPGFARGGGDDVPPGRRHPYDARTLGSFMGWLRPNGKPQRKLYTALAALAYMERGIFDHRTFEGLTTKQAQVVIEQFRHTRQRRRAPYLERIKDAERRGAPTDRASVRDLMKKQARQLVNDPVKLDRRVAGHLLNLTENGTEWAARRVATTLAKKFREGEIGSREAAKVAEAVDRRARGFPNFDELARSLLSDLGKVLDAEQDERFEAMLEIIENRAYLDRATVKDGAAMLRLVAARYSDAAVRLEAPQLDFDPGTMRSDDRHERYHARQRRLRPEQPLYATPASPPPANDEPADQPGPG